MIYTCAQSYHFNIVCMHYGVPHVVFCDMGLSSWSCICEVHIFLFIGALWPVFCTGVTEYILSVLFPKADATKGTAVHILTDTFYVNPSANSITTYANVHYHQQC